MKGLSKCVYTQISSLKKSFFSQDICIYDKMGKRHLFAVIPLGFRMWIWLIKYGFQPLDYWKSLSQEKQH